MLFLALVVSMPMLSCSLSSSISTQVMNLAQPSKSLTTPFGTTPSVPPLELIPVHPDLDLPFFKPILPEGYKASMGTGSLNAQAVSPDWSHTAFGFNQNLFVCDKLDCKIYSDDEYYRPILFSGDGKILAAISDEMLALWNVEDSSNIITMPVDGFDVAIAFSKDDSILAYAEDNKITLLNGRTGEFIRDTHLEMSGDPEAYLYTAISLAFSPDKKELAIGSRAGIIFVYSSEDLSELYTLAFPHSDIDTDKIIGDVKYSPDGKQLASSTWGGQLIVWDTETHQPIAPMGQKLSWIDYLSYSPDSKYLAVSGTSLIFLDTASGSVLYEIPFTSEVICDIFYSSDSTKLVALCSSGIVRIYDVATGEIIQSGFSIRNILGDIFGIAFSPKGDLLGSISRFGLQLWETNNYSLQFTYPNVSDFTFAFTSDAKYIAMGGWDNTIEIYSMEDNNLRLKITCDKPVTGISFSPDNKMIAVSSNDSVSVWDAQSGTKLYQWTSSNLEQSRSITAVFSPKGNFLGISSDVDGILLLNPANGELLRKLAENDLPADIHVYYQRDIAFSSDDSFVSALHLDGNIGVWNPSTGEILGEIDSVDPIQTFALSTNGDFFATYSWSYPESAISLYQGYDNTLFHEFDTSGLGVNVICFSPNGRTLVMGSTDGIILVWDIPA
jgi:WD40 repeat protein